MGYKEEYISKYGIEAYKKLREQQKAYYQKKKLADPEWYKSRIKQSNNRAKTNNYASQKLNYENNRNIRLKNARFKQKLKYCSEGEFHLIENYDKALKDDFIGWDLHHRLEEHGYTYKELKKQNLYYNRPASELIFLTHAEHTALHERLRNSILVDCYPY